MLTRNLGVPSMTCQEYVYMCTLDLIIFEKKKKKKKKKKIFDCYFPVCFQFAFKFFGDNRVPMFPKMSKKKEEAKKE